MYIDPIKINVLGADSKPKYAVVIVGNVPEAVRRELQSKNPRPQPLEKYYGKSWRKLLFMPARGGNEEDFSFEDLQLLTEATKTEEVQLVSRTGISYSFVDIFSHDTILEMKRKIEHITDIPLFCQHLNYYYKNNYFACMYTFEYKRHVFHPNIYRAIRSGDNRIDNIPVNKTFVNVAQYAKVKTYDFAVVVAELREKYNVREYNLFDLRDFIGSLHSGQNETEMRIVYYGFILPYFPMLTEPVFRDYIKLSAADFNTRYPDLKNSPSFKKMIEAETEITYGSLAFINTPKDLARVKNKIITGIEACILQVFTKYKKNNAVQIRNLFDSFPLSSQIVACACVVGHEGGRYVMKKVYKKNQHVKTHQEVNQITYKIRFNEQTTEYFYLTINRNGNYFITSNFLEEHAYDFHDIVNVLSKIVNPIIQRINSMKSTVLVGNNTISELHFKSVKFTEVKSFIIWKEPVSADNYRIFMEVMFQFSRAHIITAVESTAEYNKYYYNKGVYQIDVERIEKNIEVSNYYAFLSNAQVKHVVDSMFGRNRVMYVENRSFDMRISIEGLRDKEFITYTNYMLFALWMYTKESKSTESHVADKSVKSLKSQDPILYNFKKLYNTAIPYSKMCQKPFQPIIVEASKPGAVKYWNFTTKSAAYYHCPDPKYPNLTFLAKRHPKDYCIPCCKKNDMLESQTKSHIYQKCITDHIYTDERRSVETRYVMNYGKFIEPGRICRLPEKFVKSLIYNSYTVATPPSDAEEYLVYGVPQNAAGVKKTGLLSTLAFILEKELRDLIQELINLITQKKRLFPVLLNGEIYKYFSTYKDLTTALHDAFIARGLDSSDIPWHDVIRDLMFFFMDINLIEFIDSSPYNSNIADIIVSLPSNVTSGADVLSMKRHVVVIRKMGTVYPIFLINKDLFFSSGIIKSKTFGPQDQIIDTISHMMNYYRSKESRGSDTLELDDIYKYAESARDVEIKGLFVNKSNLCYIVHLTAKSKDLYLPIKYVYHNIHDKYEIHYEPFTRAGKNFLKPMNEFLLEYNMWVIKENKREGRALTYKTITVDRWMVFVQSKEKKVIGFQYKDLNFYMELKLSEAIKFKEADQVLIYYEPDLVNRVAFEEAPPQEDNRTHNIYKNLYHYHSYDLFILEFMNYFTTFQNKKMRAFIAAELVKKDEDIIDNIYEKLFHMYSEIYSTEPLIKVKEKLSRITINKDVDAALLNRFKLFLNNDIGKLETQIADYMKENMSLKDVQAAIDGSSYAFDFIDIHNIKNMSIADGRKQLQAIAKKLFIVRKDIKFKDSHFPNVFVSCSSKTDLQFCESNKLVVEKDKMDDYLDIFLQDVLNPLKEQWLFNVMFAENVFSFFEFTYRMDESISIVKLW